MGDPLPNHPHALPLGVLSQSNNPSLERSIIKSKAQFGRVHSHLSESESPGGEEEWLSPSADTTSSYARSPVLQCIPAQGVMYHRGAFEQGESNDQCCSPSNGNEVLSSSPRSPNTRSYFSSQSGLSHSPHQNKGHPAATMKSSGTHHHQSIRGRNRTSSETEPRAKSSRTPTQRKRGFSETESRPMRDKYDCSNREWFRHDVCFWLGKKLNTAFHFGWLHFSFYFFGLFLMLTCVSCFLCQCQMSEETMGPHLICIFVEMLVWMHVTFS